MTNAAEKTIPVVQTKHRANYPFVVQIKNTENWGTHDSAVTMAAAMESAQALQEKYPALPVRIEHNTGGLLVVQFPPKWQRKVGAEKPHRTALWSGFTEPPKLGARVTIRMNGIGPGTVTGFAVHEGYLGVMVLADEETRPEWHKKQNPENPSSVVFGMELQLTLDELYGLWDQFADTPVDEKDCIDADFLCFAKGDARESIWRWFERQDKRFVVGDVQQGIRVKG